MPDVNRETIESLSEKIETFAASLPPEERAVLIAALQGSGADVSGYASFGTGLPATLASAINLKPGTSMPSSQVMKRGSFINMKGVIKGSKV